MSNKIRNAQVSNKGRYKNIFDVISTPSPRPDGYIVIKHLNQPPYYLHVLIAAAFNDIPNFVRVQV